MSRRLIWSLILGVALSLAALIATNDQDAIANLLRHDVGSLALKIVLLIFVGGLVLAFAEQSVSATAGVGYAQIVAYATLLVVLLVRPRGLFGREHFAEVKV